MSEDSQEDAAEQAAGPTPQAGSAPYGIGYGIGLVPHRVDWVVCGDWIVGVPSYGYTLVPHPMPYVGAAGGSPQARAGEASGGDPEPPAAVGGDGDDELPESAGGAALTEVPEPAATRYVANKRSRETHSLVDPCPYVGRMAEQNRLLTDVRPDGYKWCDRCFPELADG